MKLLGLLVMALLIGAGAFIADEVINGRVPAGSMDRCAEGTAAARQAFEAGPMARAGMRLEELGPGTRDPAPDGTTPGLILCRANARFGNGARDTLWFALVPAAEGGEGRFMVHAAPGDLGRRSVLAIR